jgi:hypothetical protein
MSGGHEREAVEPSDAGADVEIPSDELVLVVATFGEFAPGATVVQGGHKPLTMLPTEASFHG